METKPASAQPLLSKGVRAVTKGSTAVDESPSVAEFDLWEDNTPPNPDCCKQRCGVPWRCGVALIAALSIAAVGCFYLSPHVPSTGTKGLLGCGTKEECLTIIDDYYLNARRQNYTGNGAGMVQTYGPGSIDGGPCGDEHCKLVEPCPNFALRGGGADGER